MSTAGYVILRKLQEREPDQMRLSSRYELLRYCITGGGEKTKKATAIEQANHDVRSHSNPEKLRLMKTPQTDPTDPSSTTSRARETARALAENREPPPML